MDKPGYGLQPAINIFISNNVMLQSQAAFSMDTMLLRQAVNELMNSRINILLSKVVLKFQVLL